MTLQDPSQSSDQPDQPEQQVAAWVRGVGAGDRRALSELVAAFDPRIQALAHRLLGDRHEAEDVRQAAWLRVMEAARRIEDPGAFRTWLFRVVVNLCRDRVRHARWTRVPVATELEEAAGPDTASSRAQQTEQRERVAAAVRALPEDERECLVLRHWHELPLAQVAAIVGRPRTTVQSALERALARLRERLAEREDGIPRDPPWSEASAAQDLRRKP